MVVNACDAPRIWFANVEPGQPLADYDVIEQLSISERHRLESIHSIDKRQEYLLSRTLMRHALSEQFGLKPQDWKFIEKPNAAPFVQNLPAGHWLSLSHSHGAICFVLHSQPVGIDLEQARVRTNFLALARAFMTDDELELLNSNPHSMADCFYRIWCAKEAFYKWLPSADQAGLYLTKISYPDLVDSQQHQLAQGHIKNCHLALVTSNLPGNTGALQAMTLDGPVQINWD